MELRRALGIALLRGGDPAGAGILEELLRADPEDRELARMLEMGPQGPDSGEN